MANSTATIRRMLAGGLIAVLLTALPAFGQTTKLRPVDEAGRDPAFAAYRKQLLQAIERRDADYVVAQSSPEVKLSFGGQYGRDMLRDSLTGAQDWQGETYWKELQTVIELGGVFLGDGSFCTPYLACMDVPGCPDCDPYETVYVTGANVPARSTPDPAASVVLRLTYDVLRLDVDSYNGQDWYPVMLPPGRIAYVSHDDARMAVDYRARFEKTAEGWRMTVFIAGD